VNPASFVFLIGLAAITAGCALISPIVGLIVGGTLAAAVAVLIERDS
jgi:ammonia channel protein AmtB